MNLQTFVQESITQIAAGIAEGHKSASEHGAIVNPLSVYFSTGETIYGTMPIEADNKSASEFRRPVVWVAFDVAVHAEEGSEGKAGFGISVGAIALGAAGKEETTSGTQSRIKFKIPVAFPVH